MTGRNFRAGCGVVALAALVSCGPDGGFDPDLRGWMGGMDTASAAAAAAPRPQPDQRGVITFSNGQVAVAQANDTPSSIAARLGLPAAELAAHNALPVDAPLQVGAVLVLPRAVAGGARGGGRAHGDPRPLRRVPARGDGPRGHPADPTDPRGPRRIRRSPREHVVAAGETAWAVARRYGVTVQDLASWNGLPADMSLRPGQRLIVPQPGQRPDELATTAPGSGSPTPTPPSAAQPLPDESTAPASAPAPDARSTDLGATRTAASSGGQFRMPVEGAIIRVYEKGRNDGIDIAAPTGTPVSAAGSGEVAAITRDSSGTPIIVVRHQGDLMTVYTNLGEVAVARGDTVAPGQSLGQAGDAGFVHFEVRRGFESLDPETFLN
ncbi:LysM peptidoglycan-binding domain-containing protein [Paracoccus aestuarii]|uniref:LysM peptidoglycan-binding domain-containing protein n=1 Tax=Paracoccus aestuarii TaxID=453842 RepID=UPI002350A797|nr:LysM peptidoglycan-binding domain-containing protein [Paracoccus aestuarii]WCQ99956.1 LysM peptidoglycan-binding domain-containing protein [Paracoccus aestuarii]